MTELMKRYEKEFGVFPAHNAQWTSTHYTSWVHLQLLRAEQEIKQLKAQLTWRLVSEKPEKEGWYLCKTQYADDTFGEETVFFNGKNFIFSWVIAWLPIPLALEGE